MPTFEDRESLASVRAKINAAITWVDNYVPPTIPPTVDQGSITFDDNEGVFIMDEGIA